MMRRASSAEFKKVDLNLIRKQMQMNLVVENLEKKNKKVSGQHDAKSLISHIELMLNPMGNSPLFQRNETFISNHSKNSGA
jgi:hypothetical protein